MYVLRILRSTYHIERGGWSTSTICPQHRALPLNDTRHTVYDTLRTYIKSFQHVRTYVERLIVECRVSVRICETFPLCSLAPTNWLEKNGVFVHINLFISTRYAAAVCNAHSGSLSTGQLGVYLVYHDKSCYKHEGSIIPGLD